MSILGLPTQAHWLPRFYFGNHSIESVDAEVLYCMVRDFGPKRIVEIGSGFSTLIGASSFP